MEVRVFFYSQTLVWNIIICTAVSGDLYDCCYCVAKVAEKFVNRHFNEYFDELTDANQFND